MEIFEAGDKGYGVKTNELIKANGFIQEYVGEVITETVYKKRLSTTYKNSRHFYAISFNGQFVIDAYSKGNITRFFNHSCNPNCEIQKWTVSGQLRLVVVANRDIEPQEELTYDYDFVWYRSNNAQNCGCGATTCRKIIGRIGVPTKKRKMEKQLIETKRSTAKPSRFKIPKVTSATNVTMVSPLTQVHIKPAPSFKKTKNWIDKWVSNFPC